MEVVGDFVGGGVSLSGSGGRVEEWQRWYRLMMDKSTTWIKTRWSVFAALLVIFCFRIFYLQGWYISAYALGINLLNLFIGFITPQKDPQTQQYILPVAAQNSSSHASEYRPFLRQVPEFTFWHHGTISVLVALATTVSLTFTPQRLMCLLPRSSLRIWICPSFGLSSSSTSSSFFSLHYDTKSP